MGVRRESQEEGKNQVTGLAPSMASMASVQHQPAAAASHRVPSAPVCVCVCANAAQGLLHQVLIPPRGWVLVVS